MVMSVRKYLKNGGIQCPACEVADMTGGGFENDDGGAWQPITCNACGARWNDVYTLSGYGELELPAPVVDYGAIAQQAWDTVCDMGDIFYDPSPQVDGTDKAHVLAVATQAVADALCAALGVEQIDVTDIAAGYGWFDLEVADAQVSC